jgi:hypothetical protein
MSAISSVISTRRLTSKNLLWFLMLIMGLAVLWREIRYLNPHNELREQHLQVRWMLLPHLLLGGVAMLSGPVQFSSRLRNRYTKAHRVLGRCYVGSILVAAPLAIAMPIYLRQDPFYIIGTVVHAGSWFVITLVAFLIARNRHVVQHRQWMIRSYAVTFSFIVVRICGKFLPLPDHEFGMFDVIMTFLVLLIPDIGMNWREITVRRGSPAAASRDQVRAVGNARSA